jgi:hypothetical protein
MEREDATVPDGLAMSLHARRMIEFPDRHSEASSKMAFRELGGELTQRPRRRLASGAAPDPR